MVGKTLTDEMVRTGAELVRRLDERGFRPDAVFWLYLPEVDEWKLFVAEVKLSDEGPRAAYQELQRTLAAEPRVETVTLDSLVVTSPYSSIVQLLGSAIRTGDGIGGTRFTNNVVNGIVVEDAYIYRLTAPVVR